MIHAPPNNSVMLGDCVRLMRGLRAETAVICPDCEFLT